ncbi:hypothetical protein F2P81_002653 [Scophthalmus maximus]|uniref:Uncharacterized protein n=1 Tax=Scophthalmus maximus TaxID=52904 RepID=A0A6A4TSB4_SCOMX|nr:hypothetical protein F2P81_002653 [Scophthalmus maximus]
MKPSPMAHAAPMEKWKTQHIKPQWRKESEKRADDSGNRIDGKCSRHNQMVPSGEECVPLAALQRAETWLLGVTGEVWQSSERWSAAAIH